MSCIGVVESLENIRNFTLTVCRDKLACKVNI